MPRARRRLRPTPPKPRRRGWSALAEPPVAVRRRAGPEQRRWSESGRSAAGSSRGDSDSSSIVRRCRR